MSHSTNERKLEHIRIIQNDAETDRNKSYFDQIQLTHRALPQINLEDIDPSIELMGKRLSFPLLISSMTGGDHDLVKTINHNLAEAAERCGVALGVGSQRVLFTHPESKASFELREKAPTTLLFGNIGAVQLNKGFELSHCQEAVDILGADGLFLHLNPLQEAIQPEGDTQFAGLMERIESISRELSVPVILKEVGCGISAADANLIRKTGIKYLDVAGSGGTSWSRIEHHRHADGPHDLGVLFQDWGLPTPVALQQMKRYRSDFTVFASGGIRNGIDMAKAMILGANLNGMAKPFLEPAMESADAVVSVIEQLRKEFLTAMFLLGTPTVNQLIDNETLLLDD